MIISWILKNQAIHETSLDHMTFCDMIVGCTIVERSTCLRCVPRQYSISYDSIPLACCKKKHIQLLTSWIVVSWSTVCKFQVPSSYLANPMFTKVHIICSKDNSAGLLIGHDNIPNFSNELWYSLYALELYTTSWLLLREIILSQPNSTSTQLELEWLHYYFLTHPPPPPTTNF